MVWTILYLDIIIIAWVPYKNHLITEFIRKMELRWWKQGEYFVDYPICDKDCRIEVSEFELQSRYYVHFRTNTLRKDMNPLILPAMG